MANFTHTIRYRNAIVLIVVSLYMLLNYGFMQIRIPPIKSGGIPIGEITLFVALSTINLFIVFSRLSRVILLTPFIIWWVMGFCHALWGISNHGMWALRDATHLIESLFIVVGFAFAGRPEAMDRFFRLLPKILVIGCIYAIGYPFSEKLMSISPTILAGSGHYVPIFFNYTNTPVVLLTAVSYILLFTSWKHPFAIRYIFIASVLFGFTAFLFQARTIYLQIIALFIFFSFYRYGINKKFICVLTSTAILLFIISVFGLDIEGRLGQKISLTFLRNHFLAIFGIESDGVVASARGVAQRIGWWRDLMGYWTNNIGTIFFGMGYGLPLIDFKMNYGVIVREPHNSYISIIARLGIIGAIAWIWMHVILIKVWHRTYKKAVDIGWQEGQNRLLILMVFFILIWIFAIGEDAFEKPFNAIPYYFFWGIVLRCASYFKYCFNRTAPIWEY